MTITETKVGQRLVCMPALKASCWKMAQHLGAKWPETALYDAKAQEGNSDFQVHRAPSDNLQAICLVPMMPLAYAGAWLRRYEETHILSSCWKLIIIRLCAVTGMFLARAKKEVKRTKHQICLWKTTRKGCKMMARTRYTYRLVLCRLIVNRHLWTHQNFLRKVFLGFIPIFFSSWFYTAIGHVARYALLSCKETATKTSLGLKSKDGKMRSIYIMWGKLNGVRIAQSKTQSLLHGNTRKMSEIIIPEKEPKWPVTGLETPKPMRKAMKNV